VSRVLWLINVGEHFFDVNIKFHILEGEVVDFTFISRSLLFLHNDFFFLPQANFMGAFNFSRRRVLISSSAKRSVGHFLNLVGCWSTTSRCCTLWSGSWGLGTLLTVTFSFLFVRLIGVEYCFQVIGVTSMSARVIISIFIQNSINKRIVEANCSRCSTKIPLGSNPFTLSSYFRFRLWK
jgi:hypothetical protein